jgi:hypothetical protein
LGKKEMLKRGMEKSFTAEFYLSVFNCQPLFGAKICLFQFNVNWEKNKNNLTGYYTYDLSYILGNGD